MTITSIKYLILLICGALLYFLSPRKFKWITLLMISILNLLFVSGISYLVLPPVFTSVVVWLCGLLFDCEKKGKIKIQRNLVLWIGILGNGSFWILFRIYTMTSSMMRLLHIQIPSIIVSAGIGYYTLISTSYLIDCYWGKCDTIKNPFKVLLYIIYFPQMVVGPISRYSTLITLHGPNRFNYKMFCFGCQRILYGFFKILVISNRFEILTSQIWANGELSPVYYIIAFVVYPIQMYMNFSGCMDVVLGASELYGIKLPENFRDPFGAENLQEFWQRWHITLGLWAKDYILFPLQKSRPMIFLRRFVKEHTNNKRLVKLIPWSVCLLCMWIFVGIWHGEPKDIVVVSFFWLVIVIEEVLHPVFGKISNILKIDTRLFSWRLLQKLKTYILFAFGALIFSCNGISDITRKIPKLFSSIFKLRPWDVFKIDNSLFTKIESVDVVIMVVGTALILFCDYYREHSGKDIREWIEKQILPFRWLMWLLMLSIVLILGIYGKGYDAGAFVYGKY